MPGLKPGSDARGIVDGTVQVSRRKKPRGVPVRTDVHSSAFSQLERLLFKFGCAIIAQSTIGRRYRSSLLCCLLCYHVGISPGAK